MQNPLPPSNGTATSLAAAESMRDRAPTDEERVRVFIRMHCNIHVQPRGATCDECEISLGMTHQNASARINALMRKGKIKDSGIRRKTRSGRAAIVWVCA